ncbi:hypothetical protein [Thermosynechococcus vestitus]|uniref:Tsr0272 protein n=1 Tax=Thermosynechococcus vestitus (strain NIES-2133 / IAM M-273 / BP-1) TaxID=197221 RepID=Q8DM51_THEVB|nr:hypothetical protein [Thermosynechococcus vestitus]BAC07825.1 tsr0272 [Thermosynechococcus vestitus BP-1]
MSKTLSVVGLSPLMGLTTLSLAATTTASMNVNGELDGGCQRVDVVPSPPSQPVYGVPPPQSNQCMGYR